MSFAGQIQGQCSRGCDPFEAEAWSLVRGDIDESLREMVLAGDLNLLSCPGCSELFFPEVTLIYQEPPAGLLAFVLPEAYRKDEASWREKMRRDYDQLRSSISGGMPLDAEPLVFFGLEPLRELLHAEDDLEDEVRVAKLLAKEIGLSMLPIQRSFARSHRLPHLVPVTGKRGAAFSRTAAVAGLKALLKANDRLESYARWLELIEKDASPVPLPPK